MFNRVIPSEDKADSKIEDELITGNKTETQVLNRPQTSSLTGFTENAPMYMTRRNDKKTNISPSQQAYNLDKAQSSKTLVLKRPQTSTIDPQDQVRMYYHQRAQEDKAKESKEKELEKAKTIGPHRLLNAPSESYLPMEDEPPKKYQGAIKESLFDYQITRVPNIQTSRIDSVTEPPELLERRIPQNAPFRYQMRGDPFYPEQQYEVPIYGANVIIRPTQVPTLPGTNPTQSTINTAPEEAGPSIGDRVIARAARALSPLRIRQTDESELLKNLLKPTNLFK
jgi:hypothetical protein